MEFDDLNDLNKMNLSLESLKESIDGEDADLAVFNFEMTCYLPVYERMINGWVIESEDMYNTLDFFIRAKEQGKSKIISVILNKYYPDYLPEKVEEFILEENYEKCSTLKKYL